MEYFRWQFSDSFFYSTNEDYVHKVLAGDAETFSGAYGLKFENIYSSDHKEI